MRQKIFMTILVSVLILLFVVSTINAQQRGIGFGKRMLMHEKNLDNLRMLKLLELLDLSDEQNDRFIGLFASFRNDEKKLKKEFHAEIEKLSKILHEPNPSETEIENQLDKIKQLKNKREQIVEEFHNNVKEMLTIVQMAKMIIFEERFERQLLETVRGFREKYGPASEDAPIPPNNHFQPGGRY